jgi:hypothetical protein
MHCSRGLPGYDLDIYRIVALSRLIRILCREAYLLFVVVMMSLPRTKLMAVPGLTPKSTDLR